MLILDSNIFIWILRADKPLSKAADTALSKHVGPLFISLATIWEIEIKRGLGKLDLGDFDWRSAALAGQFDIVDITIDDAISVGQLPMLHRDPFDRMIIAQAMNRNAVVMTTDAVFQDYGVTVLKG